MRRLILLLTLLLPLLPASSSSGATSWQKVAPAKAAFSVSMPGTPKAETQKDKDGSLTYTWTVKAGSVVYIASYFDVTDTASAKTILDAYCEGVSDGGKLDYKRAISVQGQPGRACKVEQKKDGLSARVRVVLVAKRVYALMAMSKPEAISASDVDTFLNSLKLDLPQPNKDSSGQHQ